MAEIRVKRETQRKTQEKIRSSKKAQIQELIAAYVSREADLLRGIFCLIRSSLVNADNKKRRVRTMQRHKISPVTPSTFDRL